MNNLINVLDKGYVRLLDHMGDDISVVNAARVSFKKESKWIVTYTCDKCGRVFNGPSDACYWSNIKNGNDGGCLSADDWTSTKSLSTGDEKLLKFLVKNGHMSPFRHCFMTFEVKAPLMVCRQWWKYVVGSDHTMDGWNEVSRRYVAEEPEFYIPDVWRSAPENKKQGSGQPVESGVAHVSKTDLISLIDDGISFYKQAINSGVCAEQARLMLPAFAMYTTWRWSASLQSVLHFLSQRLADDAQKEIQEYAKAVHQFAVDKFPYSIEAFNEYKN